MVEEQSSLFICCHLLPLSICGFTHLHPVTFSQEICPLTLKVLSHIQCAIFLYFPEALARYHPERSTPYISPSMNKCCYVDSAYLLKTLYSILICNSILVLQRIFYISYCSWNDNIPDSCYWCSRWDSTGAQFSEMLSFMVTFFHGRYGNKLVFKWLIIVKVCHCLLGWHEP